MIKFITYIQLKAARHALNLGVREIADLLRVSKSTISKTELNKTRDFLHKHSAALIDFFLKNHITFPTEYSIRYDVAHDTYKSESIALTRFQLRTARYVLSMSQHQLAKYTSIDRNIIMRMECLPNLNYIEESNILITSSLKAIFFQYGIEFPDPFCTYFKKYVDM